ncbi:hypothetical protein EON66_07705 [archaeon]|nr:MAG: hypothetical protein EON66_07705 [archaeon]
MSHPSCASTPRCVTRVRARESVHPSAREQQPHDGVVRGFPIASLGLQYCKNYWAALDVYRTEHDSNERFRNFLHVTSFRPSVRKQELSSFLIRPVQRICKYPLLFKDLLYVHHVADAACVCGRAVGVRWACATALCRTRRTHSCRPPPSSSPCRKHMDADHPTRERIEATLHEVEKTTNEVNARIAEAELQARIVDVYNLLDGAIPDLVEAQRRFILDVPEVTVTFPMGSEVSGVRDSLTPVLSHNLCAHARTPRRRAAVPCADHAGLFLWLHRWQAAHAAPLPVQ